VPSVAAGNASHAIGLGQMNLHGYLAREGIAYGSGGAGFHQFYFYTITWHALHTSMLMARERGSVCRLRTVALRQRRVFPPVSEGDWQPKTAKVRALFARAGIVLPDRDMWRQLRDDVMRYGIYNRTCRRCRPRALSRTSTTPPPASTRSCRRLRSARRGKPGAFTTPRRL
jgi:ribonucleoside-diphosphate reductase alpha chain